MTIRTIGMPPHRSRLLVYLLCLLISLPAGKAFGQNRSAAPNDRWASVVATDESSTDSGSLIQEAAAAQNSSLPIVFVPGTAGSELRLTSGDKKKYTDDLYWLGLSTLKKRGIMAAPLDEHGNDIEGNEVSAPNPLTAFSVSFSEGLKRFVRDHLGYAPSSYSVDVYANFLSWAYRTFGDKRFKVAPYDWRKGAKASFDSIEKAVTEALAETKQKKVILLAHSLGGLVSRDYIMRTRGERVAALIAVGTPWLGAPKAARALLWGYNFDIGIVEESKRRKKIKRLPKEFITDVCKDSKCQSLSRTSFLKRESVRDLSKNFPGVYLQLPTEEFMKKYGSYYGKSPRSVIWGMDDWHALESFYQSKNRELYDEVKLWRGENLRREDYRVPHYLIGGVYNPACKDKSTAELKKTCDIGNRMDMQMPQENQVPRSSLFRRIVVSALDALASIVKADAYDDSFVALDSAYEWGDGTSPLLSATAGVYIKGGEHPCRLGVKSETGMIEPCDPDSAKRFLGELTEARAVTLGARYGHSAMLNDPQIKQMILDIYRQVNGSHVAVINAAGVDVHSISITLKAENNLVKNELVTKFTEDGRAAELLEPQRAHLLNGKEVTIRFENPKILDSRLLAPRDRDRKHRFYTGNVYRTLRTTDLKNISISIMRRNQPSRGLLITGVEIVINGGEPYLAPDSSFTLTRSNEWREVRISPVP